MYVPDLKLKHVRLVIVVLYCGLSGSMKDFFIDQVIFSSQTMSDTFTNIV